MYQDNNLFQYNDNQLSVLRRQDTADIISGIGQAVSAEDIARVRAEYRQVRVSDDVAGYLMDLIQATRAEEFATGASTRGAIALYKAVQAAAALSGRDYALPEDIRAMAPCVLAHRVATGAGLKRTDAEARLNLLIDRIPVPVEGTP